MPPQDWTYAARLEDVLGPFASFRFDFLDVPASFLDVPASFAFGLGGRSYLSRLSPRNACRTVLRETLSSRQVARIGIP